MKAGQEMSYSQNNPLSCNEPIAEAFFARPAPRVVLPSKPNQSDYDFAEQASIEFRGNSGWVKLPSSIKPFSLDDLDNSELVNHTEFFYSDENWVAEPEPPHLITQETPQSFELGSDEAVLLESAVPNYLMHRTIPQLDTDESEPLPSTDILLEGWSEADIKKVTALMLEQFNQFEKDQNWNKVMEIGELLLKVSPDQPTIKEKMATACISIGIAHLRTRNYQATISECTRVIELLKP